MFWEEKQHITRATSFKRYAGISVFHSPTSAAASMVRGFATRKSWRGRCKASKKRLPEMQFATETVMLATTFMQQKSINDAKTCVLHTHSICVYI